MSPTTITRDEWLAALNEAVEPENSDAITMREFADLLNIGRSSARARMARLVREGKAVTVSRTLVKMNGDRQRVPAYRLKKAGK